MRWTIQYEDCTGVFIEKQDWLDHFYFFNCSQVKFYENKLVNVRLLKYNTLTKSNHK